MRVECPECGKPFETEADSGEIRCPHCESTFPAEAAAKTSILNLPPSGDVLAAEPLAEDEAPVGAAEAADDDAILAELAVQGRYVPPHQVKECLENQKAMAAMGIGQGLGEIMASKGYLSRENLKELEVQLAKRTGRHPTMGPYEVLEKVGEGGMGAVFRARVKRTGAIVALKVLPPKFAAEKSFVARFHREAEIASRLDHPNIVRAIQSGEHEGRHYFAMEFVEGESVGRRLRREKIIPEGEALRVVRQVAFALDHAYSHDMVHRDIKPDNIFLAEDGGVKLGDMGLAKEIDQEVTKITKTGVMVGTPHYVSPEQAAAQRDIDTRSDVYSLGATLYHMLTGQAPFDGSSALAILNKHLSEELPWPADVNDDLTDEACVLVQRMMAKAREDRYASPVDLIHDIDLVIRGEAPRTEMLSIGKSSIRRAVRVRKAGDAAERRRRRLDDDARRMARRAASVAGVSDRRTRQTNWIFVAGGIVAGVVMMVLAMILFFTAPEMKDWERTRADAEARGGGAFDTNLEFRKRRAKALLGEAKRYARLKPGDRQELITQYEILAKEYKDLPEGREAAAALAKLCRQPAPAKIPRGAGRFGDHRYMVYSHTVSWQTAKLMCEKMGGHLVTITSAAENDYVTGLARRSGSDVWIGLTDEGTEGRWRWVTGEPFAFSGWIRGQPDHSEGKEHWVALFSKADWSWNDQFGHLAKYYICEWDEPGRDA